MNNKSVLFRLWNKEIIKREFIELENKDVNEIFNMFHEKGKILFIYTPFFAKPLKYDLIPSKEYPFLSLDNGESKKNDSLKNEYYFAIENPSILKTNFSFEYIRSDDGIFQKINDSEFDNFISLYAHPNIRNNDDIKIPPFLVNFNIESIKKDLDLVIKQIENYFDLNHFNSQYEKSQIEDIIQKVLSQNLNEINNYIEFSCELGDGALSLIQKRKNVLEEIFDTENNFITDLITLNEFWKPILEPYLTENDLALIFKDLVIMIMCHKKFLKNLKLKGSSYGAMVGDIFLLFSDYFKFSKTYISNYSSFSQIVEAKQPKVLTMLAPNDGKDFHSYLISPVQRFPRYILFIKELLKCTPTCHPDYHYLQIANNKFQTITVEMDEATLKAQKMNQMLNIQKSLSKQFNILSPNRYLSQTKEILFNKLKAEIYLFNDFLLVSSIDKKSVLYSSTIVNMKYFPYEDQIKVLNAKKMTSIVFSSSLERKSFIEQLEIFRAQQNKRNTINMRFLWFNPFIPKIKDKSKINNQDNSVIREKKFSKLSYSDGVQINDSIFCYSDCYLVKISIKHQSITYTKSPFGSRTGFCVVGNNIDKIYFIGGKAGEEYFNDIWQYEILFGIWTKLIDGDQNFLPRCEHSAVYDDRKIIIFGGRNHKQYLNDTIIFYPITQTIEKLNVDYSPLPRSLHSAVIFTSLDNMRNKKMIIHGGRNSKIALNDIQVFDIKNLKWEKSNLDFTHIPRRFGHRSIVIYNMIVNIGGSDDSKNLQAPSVLFIDDNFSCNIYKSCGNIPNTINRCTVCFDSSSKTIIEFANGSIFCAHIPHEIENIFISGSKVEKQVRQFNMKKRKGKRESITMDDGEYYQAISVRRKLQNHGYNEVIRNAMVLDKNEIKELKKIHTPINNSLIIDNSILINNNDDSDDITTPKPRSSLRRSRNWNVTKLLSEE